jgi:subtilisin family serine protease
MRYYSVFLLFIILIGCNTSTDIDVDPKLESTAVYEEAYNEHVELNVGGKAIQVKVNGEVVSFIRRGNRVFFDLLNPPFPFTALPSSNTAYNDRGTVNVEVIVEGSSTPFTETYEPYGAVESGQINLLLPLQGLEGGCPTSGFYKEFKIVNSSSSTSGSFASRLCFMTLDIRETQSLSTTRRGTKQAINYLKQQISNEIAIDRNVLFSLDTNKSTYSSDPSCEQLEVWVNNENSNKLRIDTTKILEEVNATIAHADGILGTGVRVAVLGVGVDTSVLTRPGRVILTKNQNFLEPGDFPLDDFECNFDGNTTIDFALHETHAIETISTIAPSASIIPIKICNHDGVCTSGDVVRALMYLENTYSGRIIVNFSGGGPVRDHTVFRFLETDPNRVNESFFFVASSGNNGRAVRHYPATFSPLSTPPDSLSSDNLQNVISVGAYAITKTENSILPLFNTRRNPDIFALGVNICLPSVTIQCQTATDPGIGGSSFAAPMVSGVAALYTQAQPGVNLYTLLTTNDQVDLPHPTIGRVWYQ